jgi:DNA-binding MarR family transcriptional regulator
MTQTVEKSLQEELQQRKPFSGPQHEAQLSIIRTGSILLNAFEQMLKPYGITATQFNVLRILRGADPDGLCRNEIRCRMLTRMPDVTRLLDRMVEAGFVSRDRLSEDRRMVRTKITARGYRLLDELEPKARVEQQRPFSHLSVAELHVLIDLLARIRHTIPESDSNCS